MKELVKKRVVWVGRAHTIETIYLSYNEETGKFYVYFNTGVGNPGERNTFLEARESFKKACEMVVRFGAVIEDIPVDETADK